MNNLYANLKIFLSFEKFFGDFQERSLVGRRVLVFFGGRREGSLGDETHAEYMRPVLGDDANVQG